MKHAKVGQMGFRDMNLYTTLFDGVSLKTALGVEVEFFEMLEMVQRAAKLDKKEVRAVVERIKREWVFEEKADEELIEHSAAYYLAAGQAVKSGRWEEAGWTPPAPQLPGLEISLDVPVEEFAQRVLSQHYILAYGTHRECMKDFCRLTGMDLIE